MKYMIAIAIGFLGVAALRAQENVGIGTTTPHEKAILELQSTTKGLLLPRMSSAQRLAIASPPEGLVVYQNTGTSTRGLWYYNGSTWVRSARADELTGGSSSWTVSGDHQYSNVDGNVGIGTAFPASTLHVKGDTRVDARIYINSSTAELQFQNAGVSKGALLLSGDDLRLGTSTGSLGNLLFRTKNVDRLVIDDAGRVGIGILAPTSRLHVVGDIFQESGNLTINNTSAQIQLRRENVNKGFIQLSGDNVRMGTNSGNSGASLIFRMNGTDRIAIDSMGRLGVGTTTPVAPLNIVGTSRFEGTVVVHGGILSFTGGGPFSRGYIDASGNDLRLGTTALNSTGKLIFRMNGDERIWVLANGNMGLGVSNPGAPLQFDNSIVNRKLVLWDQNGNNHQFYGFGINSATLRYQVDQTGADHVFYAGTSSTASTELFRIKGSGNIRIGSTSPNTHKLNVAGGGVFFGNNELLKFDGSGTSRFIQFYRSGTAKAFIQLLTDDLSIGALGNGKVFVQGSQITLGTTTAANGYKVSVGGKMICEELRVDLVANWPDYVFASNYPLLPLPELKSFIETHQHLPNIPKASDVEKDGIMVGDMHRRMLEKVEELTLYILQQQEQIDNLAAELAGLKNTNKEN